MRSNPIWIERRNSIPRVSKVFAAALAFCTASIAHATYTPPPPCANPFTPQQEVTEGAKVAAQVYQQMPVLPESDPVSLYVAQLGAHLAAHAPGLKWPYTFHVVASPDVNAFALPGGAIFINLGTVQAAQTEAQLAGVLAHETSHVVLRHATCNMKKQQATNIVAGLGAIASSILLGNGAGGQAAQAIIGGGAGLYGLRMSRDDEKQADLLGTDILYNAGYDPRGLPQFFEIIQSKYGAGGAQILTDHPNPGNRTEYVTAEIETLPRLTNPMVTSAAFKRAHDLALQEQTFTAQQVKDGGWKRGNYAAGPSGPGQAENVLPTGTAQPGQATNNSPSTGQYGGDGPVALNRSQLGYGDRLTEYHGGNFRMNYPSRWRVTEATDRGATLAPVGGFGTFGLVYGAVIGTVQANGAIVDADSLANATAQLAQQLSQQNGGLQQVGSLQTLNLGNQTANAVELRGRSPLVENGSTLAERDWLVTVASQDGDLHYIVFVSPERDFAQLRPMFVSMMNSFRAL
jgi:Zn-dependent protease with chaperone function